MKPQQALDLASLHEALARADILPCGDDDRAISEDSRVQALAAPACHRCPALDLCRAYGLAWPLEVGLYGGMTQQQRQTAAHDQEGTAA